MRANRFSVIIGSGVETSSTCMAAPVAAKQITTDHHEVLRAIFAAPPKTDQLIEALLDHQNVLRDQ